MNRTAGIWNFFHRQYIHFFEDQMYQLSLYHPNSIHILAPIFWVRIGVLIKILLLFIQKSPNNKNALVQVIVVLNKPQAFAWINTGPIYRYLY